MAKAYPWITSFQARVSFRALKRSIGACLTEQNVAIEIREVDFLIVVFLVYRCVKHTSRLEYALVQLHADSAEYQQREHKQEHDVQYRRQRIQQGHHETSHAL